MMNTNKDEYVSNIHKSVMNNRYANYGIDGDIDDELFSDNYSYSFGNTFKNYRDYFIMKHYYYSYGNMTLNNDYPENNGIFQPNVVCSAKNTMKRWNYIEDDTDIKLDCSLIENNFYHTIESEQIRYRTCDCDVEEWQNLHLNFWFNWDNEPDPDAVNVQDPDPSNAVSNYLSISNSQFDKEIKRMKEVTF